MIDACQQLLDSSILQSVKGKSNQWRNANLSRVQQGPEVSNTASSSFADLEDTAFET